MNVKRTKLKNSVLQPNSTKGVTLKDIAELLGIARSTVSNAYNRPDQLSTALREKILATADELGYSGPNPAARNFRKGITKSIGLLYSSALSYAFTDPVAALFIQGVASEVESAGYTLLLVGKPGAQTSEQSTINTEAMTANVDGIIIHSFANDDPFLKAALARKLPTVMVDNFIVEGVPSVSVADAAGAESAAKHLTDLGHKQLGIITLRLSQKAHAGIVGPEQQNKTTYAPARARLIGYQKAIKQAGLNWNKHVTIIETIENNITEGQKAAATLLNLKPRPSAIIAMSDQLALGTLAEAKSQKIKVPKELSIVGFDDMPNALNSQPALTTVNQSHIDKGRQAGRLLLTQLQERQKPSSVVLDTRLVIRKSSAEFGSE